MNRIIIVVLGASALGVLTACEGVSEMTRQQVKRSETVVQSAQATVGTSEAGAIELQRARDTLEQAQKALKDEKDERAQRLASQAQLDAELAVAKSQSASALKAAEELQAGIRTLREEAQRGSTAR